MRLLIERRLRRRLDRLPALGEESLTAPAVVVAPHFDDETLGCGGLIARKLDAGARVAVVHLSDGTASHRRFMDSTTLSARRRREAVAAGRVLGLDEDEFHVLDLPDGELARHRAAASQAVAAVVERIAATQVIVPHVGDGHDDHVAVTEIGREVAAAAPGAVELVEYPIWHWHQFPWVPLASPLRRRSWPASALHGDAWRRTVAGRFGRRFASSVTHTLDIESVLEQKRAALACYETQTRREAGHDDWPTLGDVSNGAFLERLDGDREFFRVTVLGKPA